MRYNDRWYINISETYGNLNPKQLKELEWTPQDKMDWVRSIFATQIISWLDLKQEESNY